MDFGEEMDSIYIPEIDEIVSFLKSFGYSDESIKVFLDQIKYFEGEAPKRDDIVIGYLGKERVSKIIDSILKEFQDCSFKKLNILDIGAGSGFFTTRIREKLLKLGFEEVKIFGLDLCPNMLKVLVRRGIYPVWGLAENLVDCLKMLSNMYGIKVPEKFDFVISILAFHHFLDIDKALWNIRKIINPRGKVVVVDVLKYQNEELRALLRDVRPGFDLDEFRNLALRHFKYVRVEALRGVSCCEKGTSVGLFKAVFKP